MKSNVDFPDCPLEGRERISYCNRLLNADSAIDTPNTSPTSSSSCNPVSFAASNSSLATWKLTDTDRSLPIDVKAPAVVPPAPVNPASDISFRDVRESATEVHEILPPLLTWQQQDRAPSLLLQRLWLESFETAYRAKRGERKRTRSNDRLPNVGTTFGCTLGQILAHVARPREQQTRLLSAIRDELVTIAGHHELMKGDDAEVLAYGLASCSVIREGRQGLRGSSLRVDKRYGNGAAAVGITVAILVAHAVLARFEISAAEYFVTADNLRTGLKRANERLGAWSTRVRFSVADEEALCAERRALTRARVAIDSAMMLRESTMGKARDRLKYQIEAATAGAFPPHQRDGDVEVSDAPSPLPAPQSRYPMVIVPLSGLVIHSPAAQSTGRGDEFVSDTSSASWVTTSSEVSSEYDSYSLCPSI